MLLNVRNSSLPIHTLLYSRVTVQPSQSPSRKQMGLPDWHNFQRIYIYKGMIYKMRVCKAARDIGTKPKDKEERKGWKRDSGKPVLKRSVSSGQSRGGSLMNSHPSLAQAFLSLFCWISQRPGTKKAVVWAAPWGSEQMERGEGGCRGQTEALSLGSGTLSNDTFHPRRDPAARLPAAPHGVPEPGSEQALSQNVSEWWRNDGSKEIWVPAVAQQERVQTIFFRGLGKQEQNAVAIHWGWSADLYRTKP